MKDKNYIWFPPESRLHDAIKHILLIMNVYLSYHVYRTKHLIVDILNTFSTHVLLFPGRTMLLLIAAVVLGSIHTSLSDICVLDTSEKTRKIFNDTNGIFSNGTIKYVYLKLIFKNETTKSNYRINKEVIDPLTWVLAMGGRGNLLLGCPFDFKYVSLGSLSQSGIDTADVDIIDSAGCFLNGGNITAESIVEFIVQLARKAIEVKDGNNEVKICREIQSTKPRYTFGGSLI